MVAKLLAEHADLLNRYGPESPEVAAFEDRHRDNEEFADLAEAARWLKAALTT